MMREWCDGTTRHFAWSDDSYSMGGGDSGPCKGPNCYYDCPRRNSFPEKNRKAPSVVNPPKTKFHIVTQVVMTEYVPQSDEPPGRAPYAERKTVLAENKKDVPSHQVSQRVRDVMTIA